MPNNSTPSLKSNDIEDVKSSSKTELLQTSRVDSGFGKDLSNSETDLQEKTSKVKQINIGLSEAEFPTTNVHQHFRVILKPKSDTTPTSTVSQNPTSFHTPKPKLEFQNSLQEFFKSNILSVSENNVKSLSAPCNKPNSALKFDTSLNSLVFDNNSDSFVWIKGAKVYNSTELTRATTTLIDSKNEIIAEESLFESINSEPLCALVPDIEKSKIRIPIISNIISSQIDKNTSAKITNMPLTEPLILVAKKDIDSESVTSPTFFTEVRELQQLEDYKESENLLDFDTDRKPSAKRSQTPNRAITPFRPLDHDFHFPGIFAGELEPWTELNSDILSHIQSSSSLWNGANTRGSKNLNEIPQLPCNESKTKRKITKPNIESNLFLSQKRLERPILKPSLIASISLPHQNNSLKPSTPILQDYEAPIEPTISVARSRKQTSRNLHVSSAIIAAVPDDWHRQRLIASLSMKELKKIFPPLMKQCLQRHRQKLGLDESGSNVSSGTEIVTEKIGVPQPVFNHPLLTSSGAPKGIA
ncbi:hypothetical protein HK096_009114, partial [Nowakowskiella sp. JEL0078]